MSMLRAVCSHVICRMLLQANAVRAVYSQMVWPRFKLDPLSVHMSDGSVQSVGRCSDLHYSPPFVSPLLQTLQILAISEIRYFMRLTWSMLSMAALSSARWLRVITSAYASEDIVLASQSKGPRYHSLKGVLACMCGQGVSAKRLL